jgi:chemotaxis protein methyltransferase CheR
VFKDSREREILISLLTTHKTDWFREYEHFIFLKSALKEGLIDTHGKPLIVWSAAASTGEEAYSLAMFLSEIGHSFRILGTDISEDCLRKAKAGAYAKTTVDEQVELSLKKKYFLKGTGVNAGLYRIAPILAHPMKWRKYNLVDSAGLSSDLKFDIIFLRNALIYFDRESTQSIIHNVIKNLNKGGYLIIGLSETI